MARHKQTKATTGPRTNKSTKNRPRSKKSTSLKVKLKGLPIKSSSSDKQTSIREFTSPQTKVSDGRLSSRSIAREKCDDDSGEISKQRTERKSAGKDKIDTTSRAKNNPRQHRVENVSMLTLNKEDTRKTSFTQEQVDGWKPISARTVQLVKQMVQTGVSSALGNSYGETYEEVKDIVDETSHLLLTKIKTLKVPANSLGDYQTVLQQKRKMLQQTDFYEDQMNVLETAINNTEIDCESLEESIETVFDGQLHPLLEEEFTEVLNLPPLVNHKHMI